MMDRAALEMQVRDIMMAMDGLPPGHFKARAEDMVDIVELIVRNMADLDSAPSEHLMDRELPAPQTAGAVTRTCADCRWWDTKPAWDGSDDGWDEAHTCNHPESKMASGHCASPNNDGSPTTLPDFGCNQWEAKS